MTGVGAGEGDPPLGTTRVTGTHAPRLGAPPSGASGRGRNPALAAEGAALLGRTVRLGLVAQPVGAGGGTRRLRLLALSASRNLRFVSSCGSGSGSRTVRLTRRHRKPGQRIPGGIPYRWTDRQPQQHPALDDHGLPGTRPNQGCSPAMDRYSSTNDSTVASSGAVAGALSTASPSATA